MHAPVRSHRAQYVETGTTYERYKAGRSIENNVAHIAMLAMTKDVERHPRSSLPSLFRVAGQAQSASPENPR
jgi:hypothetical protein